MAMSRHLLAAMNLILFLFLFHLPSFFTFAYAQYSCPPTGPKLPRPINLGASDLVTAALRNVTSMIDDAVNGRIKAGWAVANTSFSIALVGMDSKKPFWEYHHRGSGNVRGTDHVSGDTQYHIGSMSKIVFNLMLLKSGIDLDTKITQWLPELNDPSSKIKWNEISLAALASHTGAIPANYGFSDYYTLRDKFEDWGFPRVNFEQDSPICGVTDLNGACTKELLLKGILSADPVSTPNRRPVYSQLSWTLLSYALSAYTGKSYKDLLDELVVIPLDLENTGASPGIDSRAAIPPTENWWGVDHGDNTPGGGLYSSTNDLAAFAHGILSWSILPKSTVFEWLQPKSFTSSRATLVGMPWEIYRYYNITPAYPSQVLNSFNKGGSAYGYSSVLSLFDMYGFALVVLTAGDPMARGELPDVIISALAPQLEEEQRRQARRHYVKSYIDATQSNSTFSSNSSVAGNSSSTVVKMNVTLDAGPGLIIQNLTRGDTDILAAFPKIYEATFGKLIGLPLTLWPVIRMYPADIEERTTNVDGRDIVKEDWRIKWDPVTDYDKWNGTDMVGAGISSDVCSSWLDADWIAWGGESIDRVVFVKDAQNGDILGVELPWLRADLVVLPAMNSTIVTRVPKRRVKIRGRY